MFSFLKPASDLQTLADSTTAFALDLYQQLSQANPGNLFFSPFSLSAALAMTWAGAREETARQMEQALHVILPRERHHAAFTALLGTLAGIQARGNVALHAANALWPQEKYPFLQPFIDLCQESYHARVTPLDFNQGEIARQRINTWVAEATAGNIQDIIAPGLLNDLTRLVLTNAVYFKGAWGHPFDAAVTRPGAFYSPTGEVQAQFMAQSSPFGYARLDGLQVLEMPYQGDDLSMLVLLPDARDGLPALEVRLDAATLRRWTTHLHPQEVIVKMPRFRSEGAYLLNGALQALGMPAAFNGDQADFSGMDGETHWLYISAVLHKAFIDVNEAGTEAAAASAVLMAQRAAMLPRPSFRADHPFLYLIRENSSGALLFLGSLVVP